MEGFLAENLTEEAIEEEMQKFCGFVGPLQTICTDLISLLPQAVTNPRNVIDSRLTFINLDLAH